MPFVYALKHRLETMAEIDRISSHMGFPAETMENARTTYAQTIQSISRFSPGAVAAALLITACNNGSRAHVTEEVISRAGAKRSEVSMLLRRMPKRTHRGGRTACPECTSNFLVRDRIRACLVCGNCGLIVRDRVMEYGPERRVFSKEGADARARTGPFMRHSLHDLGLPTVIARSNKGLNAKQRARAAMLRRLQRRARLAGGSERSMSAVFAAIRRITSHIGASFLRERAAMKYRAALAEGAPMGGISLNNRAAACVYVVCNEYLEHARPLREIVASLEGLSERSIRKCCKRLAKKYTPKSNAHSLVYKYIHNIADSLDHSRAVRAEAYKYFEEAKQKKLIIEGKKDLHYRADAAAIVRIASHVAGNRDTLRAVGNAIGVSHKTVNNRYRELCEKLGVREQ